MDSTTQQYAFVIVGSGLLAASICHALSNEDAKQTLWIRGRQRPHLASTDHNKIIRDVYPDQIYSKLANEALCMWEREEEFRDYFHKVGWIQRISPGGDRMGFPSRVVQEEKLWLNPNIGYADTAAALDFVVRHERDRGVTILDLDVCKFMVDADGECQGVIVEGESQYKILGRTMILSAGPWTPQLLHQSDIDFPTGIFEVVALFAGVCDDLKCNLNKLNRDMPICLEDDGEVMISKRHSILKVTTRKTFRLTSPDDAAKPHILEESKRTLKAILQRFMPAFNSNDMHFWQCCDLQTDDGRFLIDFAPNTRNLIVASGGNFHSAKFLPNFGNLVLELLGKTEPNPLYTDILRDAKWDRCKDGRHMHPGVIPKD